MSPAALVHVRLARRIARCAPAARRSSTYGSDTTGSITYSGGQASEGQGGAYRSRMHVGFNFASAGFYGSGGARVKKDNPEWNTKAVAQKADIESLQALMADVAELEEGIAQANDQLSETAIEKKQTIKRLMTSPQTVALIESLELGGQPVWGLSQSERTLVKEARTKMLSC